VGKLIGPLVSVHRTVLFLSDMYRFTLNHVIDWDQAKVVDRESNRMDRWIKEVIHIRKEQDNSMNRDEGSYQLSHIYDRLFAATSGGERKLSRPFGRRQQPLPETSTLKQQGCNLMKFYSTKTIAG